MFRIQHKEDKRGIWMCSDEVFENWSNDLGLYWAVEAAFNKIPSIHEDLPYHLQSDYKEFKCAFKSAKELIDIIPVRQLERLSKYGFEVVKVEGNAIKTYHQAFYRESEVKVKRLRRRNFLKEVAKEFALQDMGKVYKIENCLIFE